MLEAAKTGPVTLEVASCARPAPTPRQRPRPSGPSGKHPPHRGGGKSRLSYPEARSLELDGSRRGPFCRARALLQGVKRARCPCPGAGGRRRCRTHIYSGSPNCSSRDATAATHRCFVRPVGDGDEAPRRGPRAVCTTLADVTPVLLPAAARSVTRRRQSPSAPLLRCSAASQPRRPAPRRLPWRRLCDCVCVYCVWGNAGNAGDAGTRGVH